MRAGRRPLGVAWRDFVAVRLERKIGLRPHQSRIEHHCASVRFRGFLAAAEVAENEPDQVERVGVLWV